jgi:hypothetical protein
MGATFEPHPMPILFVNGSNFFWMWAWSDHVSALEVGQEGAAG